MAQEYFDIYNEHMNHIGIELRSEVHRKGHWHKSFQCWFIQDVGEKRYILFQKRHSDKDTYPNLLDITTAGHLTAGETINDGIRELREELGINVGFEELFPIGIIKEKKSEEAFTDAEFANVFLYYCKLPIEEFKLQVEEVVGMFVVELDEVIDLFDGKVKYIRAEGYEIDELEKKEHINLRLTKNDFVPHDLDYYRRIFEEAKRYSC